MKQPWIRITNWFLVAVCLVLGWMIRQQRETIAATRAAKVALAPRPVPPDLPKPAAPITRPSITLNIGAPAAGSHPARTMRHYPSRQEIVRAHPEYAGVLRRRQERFLIGDYAAVIEAMKLSPEVTAKLCNLLFERKLSAADAKEVAKADGLQPHSAEFAQAVQQAEDAVDAQIVKLVGPDGLRELRAAQQLDMYQHMVGNNIAPAVEMAGEHLTAQQSAALAQAWYETDDPTANAQATQPGFQAPDPATDLSQGDEVLLKKASHILPTSDLGALRRYLEDRNIQTLVKASYHHHT